MNEKTMELEELLKLDMQQFKRKEYSILGFRGVKQEEVATFLYEAETHDCIYAGQKKIDPPTLAKRFEESVVLDVTHDCPFLTPYYNVNIDGLHFRYNDAELLAKTRTIRIPLILQQNPDVVKRNWFKLYLNSKNYLKRCNNPELFFLTVILELKTKLEEKGFKEVK